MQNLKAAMHVMARKVWAKDRTIADRGEGRHRPVQREYVRVEAARPLHQQVRVCAKPAAGREALLPRDEVEDARHPVHHVHGILHQHESCHRQNRREQDVQLRGDTQQVHIDGRTERTCLLSHSIGAFRAAQDARMFSQGCNVYAT